MKILLIGDIVGQPGRDAIRKLVPYIRKKHSIDFVIGNAENVAGGSGLTNQTVDELLSNQVDVLTSGDHVWKKKEIYERLSKDNRILRPLNYPKACPGAGAVIIDSYKGDRIGVVNLLGRVFMHPIGCPFNAADSEVKRISAQTKIILIDIHAEATSEKIALGRYLDGRVSVVFGTHTHVQTSDEKILPGGTAYITDLGMTGPHDSVIGRKYEPVIEHFLTNMPNKFEVAEDGIELQGAIVEIDEYTGKAVSIVRVKETSPTE